MYDTVVRSYSFCNYNLTLSGDLKPVGAKAQKKVPMPNGLNLDEWIVPQSEDEEEDDEEDDDDDECDNNAANRDDNDIDQAVFEYRNSQIQCN